RHGCRRRSRRSRTDRATAAAPPGPGARIPEGYRPRPLPGPGRSRPGGPRWWRGSQPLAHAGREDAQLVAVLRDGPARDLDALLEELTLPIHDEVHDLEHRLAALLDGLDHPVRAVHALVDEVLVLALEFLLVARNVLVGLRDPQPRQPGVVQEHLVLAVDLFH